MFIRHFFSWTSCTGRGLSGNFAAAVIISLLSLAMIFVYLGCIIIYYGQNRYKSQFLSSQFPCQSTSSSFLPVTLFSLFL